MFCLRVKRLVITWRYWQLSFHRSLSVRFVGEQARQAARLGLVVLDDSSRCPVFYHDAGIGAVVGLAL